jgi:hypothetical protein
MSSFNPNIPVITDKILISQAQIRANFQAINVAFNTNHFPLTSDPEFSGMHNMLTLRPQGPTIPAGLDPTTSATQIAIYNKLVSGVPNLFFRPNNSQTPIQMTYPSIKADSSNTQYSFIAGPFIVYGGLIKGVTNGQTIHLTPGTTLLYIDLIVTSNPASPTVVAQVVPTAITGTSFTARYQTTSGTYDIYYLGIGM